MGLVFLVRHGETEWNAAQRWQGQSDIPLSETGREQARRLGERLAARWQERPEERPRRALASDLTRAIETAQILIEMAAPALVLEQSPLLRERAYGAWEGLTRPEMRARFGEATHPPDGESWEQVWRRMRTATALLRDGALVVGHGGSLRAWLADALGLGVDGIGRFSLSNASLTLLEWPDVAPARGRLLLLNDTGHQDRL